MTIFSWVQDMWLDIFGGRNKDRRHQWIKTVKNFGFFGFCFWLIHYNAEIFHLPFSPGSETPELNAEGMTVTMSPPTPASGEAAAV